MVQSAISAFRSANNPSFNVEHLVEPVLSEGQYDIFRLLLRLKFNCFTLLWRLRLSSFDDALC